jgi:hypothetical protein
MRSRAFRRHHEYRIKQRVRRYYGGYAADLPRHLGRIAHARQLCSCAMCGNPRRYFGEPTLQERRAARASWLAAPRRLARGSPLPSSPQANVRWSRRAVC